MFTAIDERGERLILLGKQDTKSLKKLREEHDFYCEVCREKVTLKLGERVIPHFAHQPGTRCEGENEPESLAHRKGKRSLYQWLENQNEAPVVELYFPDIKQRADIALPLRKKPIVIEYQCSALTPKRFKERNEGYHKLHMHPIWILGSSRLERYGPQIYKWKETDRLMPQLSSFGQAPYVIYFDGSTDEFKILSHFWLLSPSTMMADEITFHARDFPLNQLFHPPLLRENLEQKEKVWLRQKEKWRTFRAPHPGKLERYVLAICQSKRLSLSFFPPYVGLPLRDTLTTLSPTYLWQALLVLQFFYQRPIGIQISFDTIMKTFERLINKKIINVRVAHSNIDLSCCLKQYLLALQKFSILKQEKNNIYTLLKPIQWQRKSLADFSNEDAAALWRWLELEL